jgi:hypothetical protein
MDGKQQVKLKSLLHIVVDLMAYQGFCNHQCLDWTRRFSSAQCGRQPWAPTALVGLVLQYKTLAKEGRNYPARNDRSNC